MGKKEDKGRKECIVPKSILEDVSSKKKFRLSNGKRISNVPQLIDELKTSGDIVLKVHVDKNKNDIASWIKKEFNHEPLAKKIFKINKKKQMIKVLGREVKKEEKLKNEKKEMIKELEDLPDFKNIPMPKKPIDKVPPKKLTRFESKSKGEDVVPPKPSKEIIKFSNGQEKRKDGAGEKKKLSKFFGDGKKKEHKEIDHLITIKQEKNRLKEKKKNLSEREKELMHKERKLAEIEKSHMRSEEKISVLKRINDHDLRERRGHLLSRHGKVEELRKSLLEDQKKIDDAQKKLAEKEIAIDDLRAKYLNVVKEKDNVGRKRRQLNEKGTSLENAKIEIQKLKGNVDAKFTRLKELENNLKEDWKSKFSNFESLKHILEIKEKEITPLLGKFEQDILLLNEKEKALNEKIKQIDKNEKLLEDKETNIMKRSNFNLKKEERLNLKEEQLELKEIKLKEKEIEVSKHDIKLNKYISKISKNKELKENAKMLDKKLKDVENILVKKSKKLLEVVKKENQFKKWEDDLKQKDNYLDQKEEKVNIKLSVLGKKEKDYKRQMEDIVEDKFHSYLQQSIKKRRLKPLYNKKDIDYNHNKLYVLMDNCRDLIDQGNLDEAKRLYNLVRKLFVGLNIKGAEKNILDTAIRELYQEINVATVR